MKIISGLQSGADQFGLDYAILHNIPHQGNTHRDFKSTENEDLQKLTERYHVKIVSDKLRVPGLNERTLYNVQNSDATIIFVNDDINYTRGSKLTKYYCQQNNKPFLVISLSSVKLPYDFLIKRCDTINIAGQRKFLNKNSKEKIFTVLNSLLGEYI